MAYLFVEVFIILHVSFIACYRSTPDGSQISFCVIGIIPFAILAKFALYLLCILRCKLAAVLVIFWFLPVNITFGYFEARARVVYTLLYFILPISALFYCTFLGVAILTCHY